MLTEFKIHSNTQLTCVLRICLDYKIKQDLNEFKRNKAIDKYNFI